MRVHLQHRKERLYYAGEDFPLVDSEGAMNFATVGAAANVAPCEISLPVLAEWSPFDRNADPYPSRAPNLAGAELQRPA